MLCQLSYASRPSENRAKWLARGLSKMRFLVRLLEKYITVAALTQNAYSSRGFALKIKSQTGAEAALILRENHH